MKTRHRLFPSALALSFLVGCAGEESTMPDAASASPSAPSAPKAPAVPPAPPISTEDKTPALTPAPAADEAKKAEPKPSLEGPSADADAAKLLDDEIAEIKKLPADEQPTALAQAICPVSDEHLGAMGVPIKVSAEGRTFYICCKGCQKDVKGDAKGVIAKLDKLVKK